MKPKEYIKKYGPVWCDNNKKNISDFLCDLLDDFHAQVKVGGQERFNLAFFEHTLKQHREKFDRIRSLMTIPPPEDLYAELGLDEIRERLFPSSHIRSEDDRVKLLHEGFFKRLATYAMLGSMLR